MIGPNSISGLKRALKALNCGRFLVRTVEISGDLKP